MSKWKKSKLSDVIEIIGGGTPKRSEISYWNGNIPWLSVADFNNDFRFVSNSEETITELGLKKSSTKLLEKGQLIISARGTVGCLAQLSKPMAFNQSCYGLSGKSNVIDNGFLYYSLKNIISELKGKSHGSVFDTITRDTFGHIEITYPEIKKQIEISMLLGSFDEKIELNIKTNQTLEQIAQAIFKSWFIDFDPVKAKIEGGVEQAMAVISGKNATELHRLQTENPTAYRELHQLANAFPDEMVEVEGFGQVPRGWEVKSIADKQILEIIKPKIYPFDGEKEYIATANVSKNSIVGELEIITYDERPTRANMQPIVDSIWFAKMVGEHKAILIDKDDKQLLDNTILSTGFLGLKPNKNKKCFVYCYINSPYFEQAKNQLATGAVQIALNNTSFGKIEIVLPNEEVLSYFEEKISSIFSMISQNQRENQNLAKIRDLLLPKLLSGEV